MRLLLLEDDLAVRRLVTNRLEQQGVTVTVATTVAEAMTALHHEMFDAAILDLTFPTGRDWRCSTPSGPSAPPPT